MTAGLNPGAARSGGNATWGRALAVPAVLILALLAAESRPLAAQGDSGKHELSLSMMINATWSDWHGNTGHLQVRLSGKVEREAESEGEPLLLYVPKDVKASGTYSNVDVDDEEDVIFTEQGSGDIQVVGLERAIAGRNGFLTLGLMKGEMGAVMALQMAGTADPMAFLQAAANPAERGDLRVGLPIRTVRRRRDGREERRFAQPHVWIADVLRKDGSMRGAKSWRTDPKGQTPEGLTLSVQNLGGSSRISPEPGSGSVTFKVTWSVGAADYQARIVRPKPDENFVFGTREKENLLVYATAEATPKSLEDQVSSWDIDEVGGSELEIKKPGKDGEEEPDWPEGPNILFRFKGLPEDDAEFGRKTITCDRAAPVTVKLFYWKTEHDHPREETGYAEQDPNWFYYWKQGCVPGLEQFEYLDGLEAQGEFGPPNHLYVGDGAAQTYGAYSIKLYCRSPGMAGAAAAEGLGDAKPSDLEDRGLIRPFGTISFPERKGCEVCHAIVLHELRHKEIYDAWIATGQPDADGDGLPDWFERLGGAAYALDPQDPDTHFLRYQIAPKYANKGDQELLCRLRERGASPVVSLDWSYQGKQSDPPE